MEGSVPETIEQLIHRIFVELQLRYPTREGIRIIVDVHIDAERVSMVRFRAREPKRVPLEIPCVRGRSQRKLGQFLQKVADDDGGNISAGRQRVRKR
jgi:hypothetical protein